MAATAALVPAQEGFDAARERYEAMLQRPSLNRRLEGRRLLVLTKDPRVFDVLIEDYADPGEPETFVRSVLVTQLADMYGGEQPLNVWRAWREANAKPEHLWLWYRSLGIEGVGQDGRWCELFRSKLPIELRAAVLAAAADAPDGPTLDEEALGLVMDTCAALPRKEPERSLLLEGMVALFERRGRQLDGVARTVLNSVVHVMGERQTSMRTRVVLARSLARALGRDDIGPDPAGWLELLADAPQEQIELAYAKRRAAARPGFFGIAEHGRSIAYVLDASDSMLQPLTPRELADLQPLTGAGSKGEPAGGPARAEAAEREVDWSKVKNRFDGARELLKLAVRRLQPEQRFTVILFGSRAEYLGATPGLVPASRTTVEAVCAEMDAIAPKPSTNRALSRPYGVLRGETNLHGGMLLAFRAGAATKTRSRPSKAKRGRAAEPDPVPLDQYGIDTIYLLSDGAPSCDDWDGQDTNDGTTIADAETGQESEHTGAVIYHGPFAWQPYLVPELRRLNLLQRCAIHAIGLGEADFALLEQVAAVGHGTTIKIGRK